MGPVPLVYVRITVPPDVAGGGVVVVVQPTKRRVQTRRPATRCRGLSFMEYTVVAEPFKFSGNNKMISQKG
jgi:hypothetical protein